MNKKIIIAIGTILCIFLLLITVLSTNTDKTHIKPIELNNTELIHNRTNISYYDTIISVGLNKLDIKEHIIVKNLPEHMLPKNNNLEVKALIYPQNNYYVIRIIPQRSKKEALRILSHELIHLRQYVNKEIIIDGKNNVFWKGREYIINPDNYYNRPWEDEAFRLQDSLSKEISEDIFYK